ncbi:MAG TPA: hypothetical protein VHK69_11210 [Chitinophagaceae bacterium]|jgi:membrane protease YdiL (CAAX protease family)|nr:hypothetical protein [Chitinophagaceae bacterium]
MKAISFWARGHVWTARLLIVFSFLFLNAWGWMAGALLAEDGVRLGGYFLYGFLGLLLAAMVYYPDHRRKERYRHFFRRQKATDFLLVIVAFFLTVYAGNRPESVRLHRLLGTETQASVTATEPGTDIRPKKAKRLHRRALRQKLYEQWHTYRKLYRESSPAGKAALIFLTVIVAGLLAYLVAALSCSISCSGNDALAVVVLLLGAGAIIFFTVRVIRRIARGPGRKKRGEERLQATSG